MKILSLLSLFGYALLVIIISGCTSFKSITRSSARVDNNAGLLNLLPHSGLKARIAVADFDLKATKVGAEIGAGLREMLVTTLVNSSRFSVVERKDQGVDLIITATVAEFKPQASGGSAGVGAGGGAGSGELGGLLGASLNKTHLVLDLRIINATTSEILGASRVQGQSADMEKAIRICILEAARYISQTVPASYYKYDGKT